VTIARLGTAPTTTRATLTGAVWLSAQPLLLNAISVPVTAIIIRSLGAERYGEWMIAVAVMTVAAVLGNLGLRGTFIRHVAQRPEDAQRALAEQIGLRLALSILAALLGVGACWALGYGATVIACAALGGVALALTALGSTMTDLLQAFGRMRTIASVALIAGLALTLLSLAVALGGGSAVEVACAYLVGPLLSIVLLRRVLHREGLQLAMRLDAASAARLLRRCRHFASQQVLSTSSAHAEALLLPRLVSAADFGLFAAGTMPAARLATVPDAIASSAFPGLSATCGRDRRSAGPLVRRVAAAAVAVGVALAIALTLIAEPLGAILFPEGFGAFGLVVAISAWSLPLLGAELVIGTAVNAAGEDAKFARIALPSALVTIAVTVALVLGFGVVGAAWATVVRPALRLAALAPLCHRTFTRASTPSESAGAANGTTLQEATRHAA
jgi:O-antigen/teichoic acid export membrane protein